LDGFRIVCTSAAAVDVGVDVTEDFDDFLVCCVCWWVIGGKLPVGLRRKLARRSAIAAVALLLPADAIGFGLGG